MVMWLAMRGALSGAARKLHVNYHGPLHTGFAQILFEEPADAPA
jgi:protocatechuate 4,5-dioxygenase beta chain